MAGIAGFFSGTVSESLKKVVQPAGLVPATIFTLLNFAFVYPAAHADHVGIAKSFAGLSDAWQLTVITTIVFIIGYLLVNLAPTSVSTLAGDTWRGSPLHTLLTVRETRRRLNLMERLKLDPDNSPALNMQLASEFALPMPGVEHITIEPTRLGNVLLATQSQVVRRWGIDLTTLWSQLESTKDINSAPAVQTASDEKATLQLLANLILASAGFAVEAFVFDSLHHRWDSGLAALLLLPVAYVCYRIAVVQARSWGDAIEVAVDLHREDLRKSLGLRKATTVVEERGLWTKASTFFQPSPGQPDPGDLFEAAPAPGATATPSTGVEAKVVVSDIDKAPRRGEGTAPIAHWTLVSIRYLILVSRSGVACQDPEARVVVHDDRLVQVATPESEPEDGATATARIAQDGSSVVWAITGLSRGAAVALDYRLPLWALTVTNGTAVVVDKGPVGLRIDLTPGHATASPIQLDIVTNGPQDGAPTLRIGNHAQQRLPADGTFRWAISRTTASVWLTLPDDAT